MDREQKLKKSLGVWTAMSLVVGCVIGAGVFFKPYAIYGATGGAPGMGLLAWVVGGLASIFAALTFAEVAVLLPRTGGMVAYLEECYGKKVGFLAGWMQTVIFYPAFLAGYGVTVGRELGALLNVPGLALPIGLVLILGLVILNTMGSKTSGGIQVVSTVCKLIPLVLIIVCGFLLGKGENPILTPMVGEGTNAGAALGSTLLAVLFAFEGWTNVGAIAGEMKNPGKDLPKAIIGGVSIIMAVYLIINVAYLWVLPAEEMMHLESPAAAVAMALFGPVGGTLIQVGIIISVVGAGNGFLMSGSRVAYELALMVIPAESPILRKLDSNRLLACSIAIIGLLACLYSLTRQFNMLTDLAVFSCWIFYVLTFLCVIRMRKTHAHMERTYKVPLYPVIPALAILSGVYVIVSQLFLSGTQATLLSVASIAVTLLGLPVYLLLTRKK